MTLDQRAAINEFDHSAETSRNWMEIAMQFSRNADYYEGLLREIALVFGERALKDDTGRVTDSVFVSKLPAMIRDLDEDYHLIAGELQAVDDTLGNRSIFDDTPDRIQRILKALRAAAVADPQGLVQPEPKPAPKLVNLTCGVKLRWWLLPYLRLMAHLDHCGVNVNIDKVAARMQRGIVLTVRTTPIATA